MQSGHGSSPARFEIDRPLRLSARSEIYVAHDIAVPERAIILRVARNGPDANEAAARLEVARLQELRHPNLVEMLGRVRLADGRWATAMEYGGLALPDLNQNALTPQRISGIAMQVAKALSWLAANGFRYEELVPWHVLVNRRDGRDHVRLCDFRGLVPVTDTQRALIEDGRAIRGLVGWMLTASGPSAEDRRALNSVGAYPAPARQ